MPSNGCSVDDLLPIRELLRTVESLRRRAILAYMVAVVLTSLELELASSKEVQEASCFALRFDVGGRSVLTSTPWLHHGVS